MKKFTKIIIIILMISIAAGMIFPFLWTVSTSLKPKKATLQYPPELFSEEITFENYITIFEKYPFGRFLFNSCFVTLITVISQIIICSMTAFAFARFNFKFKNLLFTVFLITMMIPFQVTAIPLYLIIRSFGWVDTYLGLILPRLFSAFGIFLFRQAFMSTSREFDESALIDGANYLQVFFKIILPMNKTAIATFSIFSFMDSWNSYIWPLIVTTNQNMMTLPLGLSALQGRWSTQWNLVSAGAVVSIVPILIVYLFAQKKFIGSMSSAGLKG